MGLVALHRFSERVLSPCAEALRIAVFSSLIVVATAALAAEPGPNLSGVVFADRNGNGSRDSGEQGIAGARVSDQVVTVVTGADGRWAIDGSRGYGVAFVNPPTGYKVHGAFWKKAPAGGGSIDFGVETAATPTTFTFIHASDTHASPASQPRIEAARKIVAEKKPAFVIVTGDLVRDALRVPEEEARSYFDIYTSEIAKFPVTVWSVPGNHDIFGIERHLSLVSPKHPLYGKVMYRERLGPNYYSFDFGGIHFVALDTVDVDDLWYYGHVDATQLDWLKGDLAAIPATTPVVTFNHIPLLSAVDVLSGFRDEPPAGSLITVKGKTQYRHVVSNTADVIAAVKGHPFPVALGGHMHTRETIRYVGDGPLTRFEQSAAIVGPGGGDPIVMRSGLTLYTVTDGKVSEGTFLPLP